MKNELIKRMSTEAFDKVKPLHIILDHVIDCFVTTFGDQPGSPDLIYRPTDGIFISPFADEAKLVIERNFNTFSIDVKVVTPDNYIVASCSLDVNNDYSETYKRMSDDLKKTVQSFFNSISSADITTELSSKPSTPPEIHESDVDVIQPEE